MPSYESPHIDRPSEGEQRGRENPHGTGTFLQRSIGITSHQKDKSWQDEHRIKIMGEIKKHRLHFLVTGAQDGVAW